MEGLYNLLKSVSDNLDFDCEFQQGRASDINIFSDNNKSVLIWCSNFTSTGTFPNQGNRIQRNFTVELAFYQQDLIDSTNDDVRGILETTDKIVLNYLLDLNTQIADIDNAAYDIEVLNIAQQPFVKVFTHVLTGHVVTFNIVLPDNFNYCV